MPAALRFLEDDESTITTSEALGNVQSPGTSTPIKRFIENFGDQDAEDLILTIVQVGNNDGDDYAQIAPDSGGSPGTWTTSPIVFGTLPDSATAPFWVRANVPAGRTADNNPRRFDLDATALSV